MIENSMVVDWWWPEYHTMTEEEEDRWAEAHDNEDKGGD